MTTLRQEAFLMTKAMPEDGLIELIRYMTAYNNQYAEKAHRIAFKKLKKVQKKMGIDIF